MSFPVSIAAAVSTPEAVTCALAFTAAFVAATVSVRAVIRATRRSGDPAGRILALGIIAILATLAALAGGGVMLPAGVWAAAPAIAIALALVLAPPAARYLRPDWLDARRRDDSGRRDSRGRATIDAVSSAPFSSRS